MHSVLLRFLIVIVLEAPSTSSNVPPPEHVEHDRRLLDVVVVGVPADDVLAEPGHQHQSQVSVVSRDIVLTNHSPPAHQQHARAGVDDLLGHDVVLLAVVVVVDLHQVQHRHEPLVRVRGHVPLSQGII